MKIKRAGVLLGTLAFGSGLLAFGPALSPARAGSNAGWSVQNAMGVTEGNLGDTTAMTFSLVHPGEPSTPACELIVQTVNITAAGGSDYVAYALTTLQIPANATQYQVDVTVTGDVNFEPDEDLALQIFPGNGVNLPPCAVADGQGEGTIFNDDISVLGINMDPDLPVCESALPDGTITVRVRFSRDLVAGEEVAFDLQTTNGQAVEPGDYGVFSTHVHLTGPTSLDLNDNGTPMNSADDFYELTYPITIIDDFTPELDETFDVRLLNFSCTGAPGFALGDDDQTVIIRNDDVIGQEIYVNSPSQVEGNPVANPSLIFTISSKYPAICDGLKIHYYTSDGTALSAQPDYTPTSGWTLIPPGGTSVNVPVTIISDLQIENDETVNLTVDAPIGVGLVTNFGTIIDDDYPNLSISDATVVEGTGLGTTNLVFTLTLSGTVDSPTFVPHKLITVHYTTSNGTATAPADYTAANNLTVQIAPNASSGQISIPVVRDAIPENNETMFVTITADYAIVNDGLGQGTIWNDDAWVVDGIDTSVLEGTPPDGNHIVLVTLHLNAPAPTQGFSVDWSLDDITASAAQPDYIDANGTAVFGSGVQDVTVPVTIVPDELFEPDETLLVNLSNPGVNVSPGGCVGGCFVLGIGHEPVVTIGNDDPEDIPDTGADTGPLTAVGFGILGAGLLLVFGSRRRRAVA